MSLHSSVDISKIAGNASDKLKEVVGDPYRFAGLTLTPGKLFGYDIAQRMVVTEVSIVPKAEEPSKEEGRVVLELSVEEDMLNGGGKIHGGCSAFIVDLCSTLAIALLATHKSGNFIPTVSQSLNMVYHSPADLGDKLRVINTTMTMGARAMSARTEIWNVTHKRLVASGVHIKMQPSSPKTKL